MICITQTNLKTCLNKISLMHKKKPLLNIFHLHEIFEQANLIYSGKIIRTMVASVGCGYGFPGKACVGTSRDDGNVLHLDKDLGCPSEYGCLNSLNDTQKMYALNYI